MYINNSGQNFSVVSNYGAITISGNVSEMESSNQNDIIVGSDNWEDIRLFGGNDVITAGDGPDRIRFKLWDVDDLEAYAQTSFYLTDPDETDEFVFYAELSDDNNWLRYSIFYY